MLVARCARCGQLFPRASGLGLDMSSVESGQVKGMTDEALETPTRLDGVRTHRDGQDGLPQLHPPPTVFTGRSEELAFFGERIAPDVEVH